LIATEENKRKIGLNRKRGQQLMKKTTKKKLNDTKSQRLREQLQARYLELDKEMKRPMKGD